MSSASSGGNFGTAAVLGAAACCAAAVAAAAVYAHPEFFTGTRRGTLSLTLAGLLERHAQRRRARRPVRVYMAGRCTSNAVDP
jgi:hypothetical protein